MTGGRPEAKAWHVRSLSAAWAMGLDAQRQRTRRKRARATQASRRRSQEQVESPILVSCLKLSQESEDSIDEKFISSSIANSSSPKNYGHGLCMLSGEADRSPDTAMGKAFSPCAKQFSVEKGCFQPCFRSYTGAPKMNARALLARALSLIHI